MTRSGGQQLASRCTAFVATEGGDEQSRCARVTRRQSDWTWTRSRPSRRAFPRAYHCDEWVKSRTLTKETILLPVVSKRCSLPFRCHGSAKPLPTWALASSPIWTQIIPFVDGALAPIGAQGQDCCADVVGRHSPL